MIPPMTLFPENTNEISILYEIYWPIHGCRYGLTSLKNGHMYKLLRYAQMNWMTKQIWNIHVHRFSMRGEIKKKERIRIKEIILDDWGRWWWLDAWDMSDDSWFCFGTVANRTMKWTLYHLEDVVVCQPRKLAKATGGALGANFTNLSHIWPHTWHPFTASTRVNGQIWSFNPNFKPCRENYL